MADLFSDIHCRSQNVLTIFRDISEMVSMASVMGELCPGSSILQAKEIGR